MGFFHETVAAIREIDFTAVLGNLLDVLLVSYLAYRLILLARGTRAQQLLLGLVVFFLALFLSDRLGLQTLNWLLRLVLPLGPVILVILFLPELRHTLEEFGRLGFWSRAFAITGIGLAPSPREEVGRMIDEVVRVVTGMSNRKIGALIVFERESGLDDVASTGTPVDAELSSELLGSLFYPGSPLHDGAVIVRGTRVLAAGCTLPLTESPQVGTTIHTRHKAAIGISEQSDAVVVVVSEETGTVSFADDGKLVRGLRDETLRERLREALLPPPPAPTGLRRLGTSARDAFSRRERPEKGATKSKAQTEGSRG